MERIISESVTEENWTEHIGLGNEVILNTDPDDLVCTQGKNPCREKMINCCIKKFHCCSNLAPVWLKEYKPNIFNESVDCE